MHKVKFIHIICTDPRIQKIYHDYLVDNNLFGEFDTIEYENPILDFLHPEKLTNMIERIKIYRELHGADSIKFFDHFGCGAYEKSGYKFKNFNKEKEIHRKNNKRVKEILKKEFPDMEVEFKYIKIDEKKCTWLD